MGMTSKEYHEGYQQGFKNAKADYKSHLKADLVAVLEELKTEIEKKRLDNPDFNMWEDGYDTSNNIDCNIIQQKINNLKES